MQLAMALLGWRYLFYTLYHASLVTVLVSQRAAHAASVANRNIPVNWTLEGVAQYSPSSPLNVQIKQVLMFQCEPDDDQSKVFALEADVFANISKACSSGSTHSPVICPSRPLTDCVNPRPEHVVHEGSTTITNPCMATSNFIPGRLYYLTNLVDNRSRCLFALPVRICPETGCGQPDSSTSSPSPLPSLLPSSTLPPSLSPSMTADSSGGSGDLTSSITYTLVEPTTTSSVDPPMVPTSGSPSMVPTSGSPAFTLESTVLVMCVSTIFTVWNYFLC